MSAAKQLGAVAPNDDVSHELTANEAMMRDGLMTVKAVADHCMVSRAHVYNLMARGELAYVRLGKLRRVPRHALLSLTAAALVGGGK